MIAIIATGKRNSTPSLRWSRLVLAPLAADAAAMILSPVRISGYPLQGRARPKRGEHDTGYTNHSGKQQRLRNRCKVAVAPCRGQIDETIERLAIWGQAGESFKYIRKPLRWKKLAAHDGEQRDHERGHRGSLFGVLRKAHQESGQANCHQHTGRNQRSNRKWVAPLSA